MRIIKISNYEYDEDYEMSEDSISQAWELVKKSDINVLRDKELRDIEHIGGEVAGALFDSWDNGTYSFDVVVDPKFQGQGIGTKLVDSAISFFNYESEAYPNADISIDVVSPIMKNILLNKGFEITDIIGEHIYMSLKNT
jgi:ribosomal protein S18 acetylase RimI-like enzyme